MAPSSYNVKDLYKDIYTINGYFDDKKVGSAIMEITNGEIHKYCHYGNTSGKCNGYFEKASSGVIHLLKTLKERHGLEHDKLAEYAILWLSYKLSMKPQNKLTDLNKFYNQYIVKNEYYNKKINGNDSLTYKAIIDTKKDLIDIKEIYKFNYPFSILCLFYNKIKNNKVDCTNYSSYPEKLANKFKELNKDSNITGNTSYKKLLSTLSDDYNNLKTKYDNNNSCKFPPIPELTPKKIDAQPTALSSEVTSSSWSVSTTLIPALSTFSVIPVFLGIAYKYSLFGVDKLFQRQYLRKKLKKVKKKMKLNI
ncbi:CIR protein PIR protein [Plasmodium vinckei brucechwatti]|uniref:CIR protein PIR protein n=1 Tax=Plasmodium vinckei brucechwatti TaxID=119398 RepID=A0A6V7SKH9_PLAVN|nr:CIR protein PIR protein [Plasmodium vinckei brucechwatti]